MWEETSNTLSGDKLLLVLLNHITYVQNKLREVLVYMTKWAAQGQSGFTNWNKTQSHQ